MKRSFVSMALVVLLGTTLAACGTTPKPTVPPATQTPWIIVVTATPGAEEVAQVPPTPVVVTVVVTATPTRGAAAKATPTSRPIQGTPSATPSPEASAPTATPTPTRTSLPPTPTNTPAPGELKYSAPVLLEPPDGAPFSWKSTVLMKWTSVGELAEDEYYHLHLDVYRQTDGKQEYGDYVLTKDTSYLAEGAFLAPFHLPAVDGLGRVEWSVRVVRKTGVDANGKPVGVDLSLPSEKRSFILDPKPSDA
jgi:hypothetical protein